MIRKVFSVGLLLLLCVLPLFSEDIYTDFLRFKCGLYNAGTDQERQTLLAEYKDRLDNSALSEQDALALNTLFVLEQAVFEKDASGIQNKKELYLRYTRQNEQCTAFMEKNGKASVSPFLLSGWADIKSRLTAFLSGQDMYTEANAARKLYLEALKKDKKFSQGYVSYGLWLFFAPPIAGGGAEAALKEFSKAVSYANTPEEKYLALIYRSQIYVALEDEKKAAADLHTAAALIPNERFTQIIMEYNKHGKIFFE
ncbi:MAG: hypothetical protein P1P65_01800 [Treponema sp.]